MNRSEKVAQVEKILGYTFNDKSLIQQAITHPSAVEGNRLEGSYERLEFLGDSILGGLVALELFRGYPDLDEGKLTRMKVAAVSGAMLTKVATEAGLADVIIFGGSERGADARGLSSALENVYEAIIGALFLDSGIDMCYEWVSRTIAVHFEGGLDDVVENPKSLLQEVIQRDFKETPQYVIIESRGPAHMPTFVCEARVGERTVGAGEGGSKKDAEAQAAYDALKQLGYYESNGT